MRVNNAVTKEIYIHTHKFVSFLDNDLKLCSKLLETYLKHDDSYYLDLDGKILFEELKIIRERFQKSNYIVLNFLKIVNCFLMYVVIFFVKIFLTTYNVAKIIILL